MNFLNRNDFNNFKEKLQTNTHFRNLGIVLILASLFPYIYTLIQATIIPFVALLSIPEGAGLEALGYIMFYSIIILLLVLAGVVILGAKLFRGKKRGYVFLLIGTLIIVFANQYILIEIDLIESIKADTLKEQKEAKDYLRKIYELDK